ncbi:MAG: two-component regulator propeller domain-containing protein [Melioribacteraceae bacterium]|nr:MAG: two-component regulator propeller domain-containing protein [Melioribacteraceae bacterium]
MNKITLVFLFIILAIFLTAKNDHVFQNLQVSSFSFEEGISHQTVYNIYKDSKGFLWFGTMYGLVHYMGAHTNVYRHEPNNKNSLSNDDVTKIFEDRDGNFWIATFGGGFNKFDIKKNKFTRYTPSSLNLVDECNGIVWDIKQSENGKILIATDNYGIIVLDQKNGSSIFVNDFENNDEVNGEKKFAINSSGEIFLISKSYTLYKYNDISNSFSKYSFEVLDLDKVRSVYFKNHIAWIYSDGKIIRYDESTHEHEVISDKFPEINSIQNITEIFVDSKNNVWFGSLGIVAVLNYELEQVHIFSSSDTGKNKIHRGAVVSIVEDREGTIWIGSYTGGINKIFSRENVFKSINYNEHDLTKLPGNIVSSILPVNDNELLIGTNAGLSKHNKQNNSFENYFLNKSIFSIKQISETNFLIGTNSGLYLTDNSLNIEKHFTHNPQEENSLTAGPIICLLIDSSNNIWAGTNFGLNKIDKTTDKVIRLTDDPAINNDITGNTILSLYEDAKGYIYAGTYNGLNQYDPKTNTFRIFRNDPEIPNTISNNYVFSYCEDAYGNLWIGTGGGLNKFNRDDGTFELISEQHGLGNSVIFGIVEFNNHLFLSTANGISVLDLESGQINSFTSEHGLHGNMFTARSYSVSGNEIYFGGVNGLSIIDTENYLKSSVTTPIKILSVTSAEENLFPNFAYNEVAKLKSLITQIISGFISLLWILYQRKTSTLNTNSMALIQLGLILTINHLPNMLFFHRGNIN